MLLYADDLVILCDSEVELGKNLSYLEKYSDKNQLTVNVGKTQILPFARSGQIGNKGIKFLYKNEKIEVVNKIVYLGVTLTTTSLFKAMADTTVERAKHAIGNVIGLMAKTKMNSWTSRVQLFDSLVQSLVMNCVPVWGMRYADQLERIQITFFKKLLHLSINTPDYAVRLETGRVKISFTIFKLTLNWLIKLSQMHDLRLPLICFLRQLQISSANNSINTNRYNWVSQFKQYFQILDYEFSWDENISDWLLKNKKSMLKKYMDMLHQEDIQAVSMSTFSTIYKHLSVDTSVQKYLEFQIPIKYIRAMAQLRSPLICFLRQLQISSANNSINTNRYNWVSELKQYFQILDYEIPWDENISNWRLKNKKSMLKKYMDMLHQEDIHAVPMSTFSTTYKHLSVDTSVQKYLEFQIPIKYIRAMAQLRTSNRHVLKFTYNASPFCFRIIMTTHAEQVSAKRLNLEKATNFMRQFRDPHSRELKKLSANQFMEVWSHYDKDGNGYIEGVELDGFLREFVSSANISDVGPEVVSDEMLVELKSCFMEAYDDNQDGKIDIRELAQLLPMEENFLLLFRFDNPLESSVEFMK
uniref:Uncharacterized protein LOC114334767 n=1 Tax=Diabrotica virgifera virgifera TaxID=50390 RepID=A0A6P7G713_DIAVI